MNPLTRRKFDRALDRVWADFRRFPRFWRATQRLLAIENHEHTAAALRRQHQQAQKL